MTDSQRWFSLVIILCICVLIYLLGPVLVPFLIAFFLAYVLNPVVIKLHAWRIPKIVAAWMVFLLALVMIFGVLLVIVPTLERQGAEFFARLPLMVDWIQGRFLPWLGERFHFSMQNNTIFLRTAILSHIQASGTVAKSVWQTLTHSGYMLLVWMMNLIMIPVVTLYLLSDWDKITKSAKNWLPMHSHQRDTFARLLLQCGQVLGGFFRGQLLVMIAQAIVYSVGLSLIGIDLAILIGIISGVLTIIPYLGFFTGLIIAILAALIQFHAAMMPILWVCVVFFVGACTENFIFAPWFVGDRIGIHPVAVIFSVLAGGDLFGFVGVLLALPAAAVIMVFFRYLRDRYFGIARDGQR